MLRVAIVDDEPLAVRRLSSLLDDLGGVELVGSAGNAALARHLIAEQRPDLVLLDIKMPGEGGLCLARTLRGWAHPPLIAFVTAFPKFAVDAFGVAAIDYLVKPVEPERLAEALGRAREQRRLPAMTQGPDPAGGDRSEPPRPRLLVRADGGSSFIDIEAIISVEAERDYVRVRTTGRSFFFRSRIASLEARLSPYGFVRVHRSTLVALDAVEALEADGRGWGVRVRGGRRLAVSRRLVVGVRKALAAVGIGS